MTLVEMHLEPFGNKLKFVPESFSQNTGVPFRIGNIRSKRFKGRTDNLLNVCQRFFVHNPSR